jgi:Domain of unknown function (DUF4266)
MKIRILRLALFAGAGAIALAVLGGCANPDLVKVHPWERTTLADYTMRADRDPLATAMAEHVYFSREAATGGRGVGGSGCGCN